MTPAPEFDADRYMRAYPDVALSGLDPRYHFERYGRLMGRSAAPKIDPRLDDPDTTRLLAAGDPATLDRVYARGAVVDRSLPRHAERVSVIMPSFNNGAFIARAINAVLSQRGVDVELIVIDDGSTDDSVKIARGLAARAPNLKVISLLRNFGCYYARNIGVRAATGDYITLLDSDDIMTPDRLVLQLDAVKSRPGAVASQSRLRRWSADFTNPISELKYAENSLMWRRGIIDEIGFYDSVRFGGDTEFRARLQARYGVDAIVRIPDEQYFLRTLQESLTAGGGSQAYEIQDGKLKLQLSPERSAYSRNLSDWHGSGKPLHVDFPQLFRPFALGSDQQNASPAMGQRRVGAMASFPPRREALAAALDSILPQLDHLILYLNDYDDVPECARHPKVRVVRSQDARGDLRDNGKFFDLPQDDDSYVFTFDDDLIYPPDYTATMIHQIETLGRSSVVGLHAITFPQTGEFTDLKQRQVSHFLYQKRGHFADLLGTGTTAWHSSTLKLKLDDFGSRGVCDLWFAAITATRGVPLFSIPRQTGWMKLFKVFEENLYQEALSRPNGYFDVYHKVVAPVLKSGALRIAAEAVLLDRHGPDALWAAQFDLRTPSVP